MGAVAPRACTGHTHIQCMLSSTIRVYIPCIHSMHALLCNACVFLLAYLMMWVCTRVSFIHVCVCVCVCVGMRVCVWLRLTFV